MYTGLAFKTASSYLPLHSNYLLLLLMKTTYFNLFSKLSFVLAFLIVGALLLSSCEKEETFSGNPLITQVRLLNPEKKDSTFNSALPGTQVLIEGQNLGGIVKAYFNDYEAGFNSTYNTNVNLIVTIPYQAPTEATKPDVSNKIRLVTTHGETSFDFVLEIPPPAISYIVNENALPGDSLTIVGSSLWLIEKVVFPGNKEITVTTGNEAGTKLQLVMPDLGTDAGPITIFAKYGTVTSAPINMFASDGVISNLTASWETGEPSVFNWSWWGANRTTDASIFPGTRGAYLQSVFGGVGADNGGWWNDNRAGNFDPTKVVNDLAALSEPASNYALKFEINTKEPWTTAVCVLRFGDNYAYRWKPFETSPDKVFFTENKWRTITVPISEFKTVSGGVEGTGSAATTLGSVLTADGKAAFTYRIVSEAQPIDIFNSAFDNIRVVKIK
jgi:hypothetical protein